MKALYLRIHYWFNVKSGGSVAHTAGVINALSQQVELDVLTNDELPGVQRSFALFSPIKFKFLCDSICELLYSFKIIRHLKKTIQNYDFIYQRYSGSSFAGAYLAQRYNVPLILEFNSSDIWKMKNWRTKTNLIKAIIDPIYRMIWKVPVTKWVESYNLQAATLVAVVSEAMKENLLAMNVPPEKIFVNHNGVNAGIYSPDVDGMEIRSNYNFKEKTVLGFIGTFGQWHGVVKLCKAIVLFFGSNPDKLDNVRFFLIGDGILMPEAKKVIDNSPYKDNVAFTGRITQELGPEYLAACDILLSPHIPNPDGTEFFGSPIKLFEYMAMGKPIIASRLGQIGDVLEHKKTAYLVEPGNVENLAEAMDTLIMEPGLCNVLGQNARAEVLSKYTWEKHVWKIIEKLKEQIKTS